MKGNYLNREVQTGVLVEKEPSHRCDKRLSRARTEELQVFGSMCLNALSMKRAAPCGRDALISRQFSITVYSLQLVCGSKPDT